MTSKSGSLNGVKSDVIGLAFNQDGGCFAVGSKNGYRIYNCDPLKKLVDDVFTGGILIVEMLFRCNYVALVGTGANVNFPKNKVIIWDSMKKVRVSEIEMKSDIRAVKLRRDRICVVVDHFIGIYSFSDSPRTLHCLETWTNPRGVCALSPAVDTSLLAFPSPSGNGHVGIFNLASPDSHPINIKAHNHDVVEVVFNNPGTLLATASDKGTLIRLFNCEHGYLLKEFRRGSQAATILSICFSPDSSLMAVASSHSTIHLFSVVPPSKPLSAKVSSVERYFKGDVSISRLKIPPASQADSLCKCAFDSNSERVVVVSSDGSYHRFTLEQQSGKCVQQTNCLFSEIG